MNLSGGVALRENYRPLRLVHEQYTIPAVDQSYRFRLVPFDSREHDAGELVFSYQ